jgi:hypothetical protein
VALHVIDRFLIQVGTVLDRIDARTHRVHDGVDVLRMSRDFHVMHVCLLDSRTHLLERQLLVVG